MNRQWRGLRGRTMSDRRTVSHARQVWSGMGRTHFVYMAFSPDGTLLYVGQTSRPYERASAHRNSSAWFHEAARFRMLGPYPKRVALALERRLIEENQPAHNIKWVAA